MRDRDEEKLKAEVKKFKEELNAKRFLIAGEFFKLVGKGPEQLNRNFPAETYIPSSLHLKKCQPCTYYDLLL